jgi:hypothetical protein
MPSLNVPFAEWNHADLDRHISMDEFDAGRFKLELVFIAIRHLIACRFFVDVLILGETMTIRKVFSGVIIAIIILTYGCRVSSAHPTVLT